MTAAVPSVSIVMAAYRRPLQLAQTLNSINNQSYPGLNIVVVEDGDNRDGTSDICSALGAQYICRHNRPDPADVPFSNPAIPLNIGIRAATGDILIIQNPECTHHGPVIQTLVDNLLRVTAATESHPGSPAAVFAAVSAKDENYQHAAWLTHPEYSPRPFFFCGAIHRSTMLRTRGFDEDYLYAGYDDADMAERLANEGHRFVFLDDSAAIVHHLYHPAAADSDLGRCQAEINARLFAEKQRQRACRDIGDTRNLGRAWGVDRDPTRSD